jgi:putative transposase
MARKPRVEFEGALYHVIVRGNHRRDIFRDEADRVTYLGRVEHYRERYQCVVYAYVLMSNHVHMLVETGAVGLSKIMQGIQFSYTQRYNRRYRAVGHLFQGRYKSILCDRDAYLLELVRYIHLNPARMKHAQDPWKYPWSSHRAYVGENSPVRVRTDAVLKQFASNMRAARRAYRGFMRDGLDQGHLDRFYETIEQRFLGDERFVEEVERKKKEREPGKIKVKFDRLVEGVASVYGIEAVRLLGTERKRRWVEPRSLLVYAAREWCGMKTSVLAEHLHRDASMISRLHSAYVERRDRRSESELQRWLQIKSTTHARP